VRPRRIRSTAGYFVRADARPVMTGSVAAAIPTA
jgi:hypothetical protein